MDSIATVISNLALTLTASSSLALANRDDPLFVTSLAIVAIYSILGTLKGAATNDGGDMIERIYDCFTTLIIPAVALPAMNTSIWIKEKIAPEAYCYLHLVPAVVIVVLSVADYIDQCFIDSLVAIESLSLMAVGIYAQNYYAIGAGGAFALMHFLLSPDYEQPSDYHTSSERLYRYVLAAAAFCGLQALNNISKEDLYCLYRKWAKKT